MVKPHAVAAGLTARIIDWYENGGLRIVGEVGLTLTELQARELYKEHDGKPFFKSLIESTREGPVVVLVMEGGNAIETVRRINGATKPTEAAIGTIRRDMWDHNVPQPVNSRNTVHGSDSTEAVDHELRAIFPFPTQD